MQRYGEEGYLSILNSYNMSDDGKQEIRDTLDGCLELLQNKIKAGKFTASDMRALLGAFTAGGGVIATVSDLAELYGTSEVNVRSVIKRRVRGKPRRRVYYDFLEFSRAVPKTWHVKRPVPTDYDK